MGLHKSNFALSFEKRVANVQSSCLKGSIAKHGKFFQVHWARTQLDTADISPQVSELQSLWALRNWSRSRGKSGNVGKEIKRTSYHGVLPSLHRQASESLPSILNCMLT